MTHAQSLQDRNRGSAHPRKTPVADIAGIINDKENRKLQLNPGGNDTVAAIQQSGVLHHDGRLLADQSSSCANPYSFFFTTQGHMNHIRIPLECVDKVETINIRKTGDQIDPDCFYGFQYSY